MAGCRVKPASSTLLPTMPLANNSADTGATSSLSFEEFADLIVGGSRTFSFKL
jgi:hypothetical protein